MSKSRLKLLFFSLLLGAMIFAHPAAPAFALEEDSAGISAVSPDEETSAAATEEHSEAAEEGEEKGGIPLLDVTTYSS